MFKRVFNWLGLGTNFFSNVFVLIVGSVFSQGLAVVCSPILTRIFSPEDFGAYSSWFAVATVLSVLLMGKYELAIPQIRSEKGKKEAFWILFLFSFSFAIILCVNSIYIRHFWENFRISMIIMAFSAAFSRLFGYFLISQSRFKELALFNSLISLLTIIFTIILGYYASSFALNGLITGKLMASLFGLVLAFFLCGNIFSAKVTSKKIKVFFRKHLNFPKFNLPHSLFNSFSEQLPVFFLGFYFDNSVVGFYSLGRRIVLAPVGIFTSSFSQVFYKKLVEAKIRKNVNFIFKKTMLVALILGFLFFLFLFLFLPAVIGVIFGVQWQEAGLYLQILIPSFYLRSVGSLLANVVLVANAQKNAFYFEIFNTLCRITGLLAGGYMNDPYLALGLYSITSFIVTAVRLVWYFRLSKEL